MGGPTSTEREQGPCSWLQPAIGRVDSSVGQAVDAGFAARVDRSDGREENPGRPMLELWP